MRRPRDRLRRAAHADPDLEPLPGIDRWIHRLVLEPAARLSRPRHGLLFEQRRQQLETLLEQQLVLLEIESEQRKRLGERPAADDDLGAAAAHGIQRREALVDADGIVRAQHRHRRPDVNLRRASRNRRAEHLRRRNREVLAVMLAEADEGEADLVGQHRLFDDVAQHLGVGKGGAARVGGDVAEGI